MLAIGVLMVVWNCLRSLRVGRIAPADPWQAATGWSGTPPRRRRPHNFDSLPPIRSERPLCDLRRSAQPAPQPEPQEVA